MIYIGIDPGVKTGWAAWTTEGKMLYSLKTLSFWQTISEIYKIGGEFCNEKESLVFVIEDPTQNKPVFFRPGIDSPQMVSRIAQNVGSNKRDCQLLIEKIEELGFKIIKKRPGARSFTKLNAEQFKSMTRVDIKCSQHARDAAGLVFGY